MASAAVHSVHIYDEHASLINRLCGIVTSGLQIGGSVLIVATSFHRDQLVKELTKAGVNIRKHARDGTFAMYDAEATLATFMVEGRPDREFFMKSVGDLLKAAKKKARNKAGSLTVFGEMVSVLWDQGHKQAALELEELWNDALNDRAFHLHCAYPRWGFIRDDAETAMADVCRAHSHILLQ